MQLIGPFGLFTPDGQQIVVPSQKGMAMLAYIALGPKGARARRKLEAMFWGERGSKQAKDSLRRELSNCRRILRAARAEELLTSDMQRVGLNLEMIGVDVLSLGAGQGGALGATGGDLLEGIDLADCEEFEDWLRTAREGLARQWRDAADEAGPFVSCTTQQPFNELAPKPAIAILPFTIRGAAGEAWQGEALAESLSLRLAEFPQLLVLSSSASASLSQTLHDRVALARELRAQYLVEGTLFERGDSGNIVVHLIDGMTGEQIFGGDFPSAETARLAHAVAPQVWTAVDTSERRRILRRPSAALTHYDKYWKANALYRSWRGEDVAAAAKLAKELHALDPTCPWAGSLAAMTHGLGYVLGALPDREAARAEALDYTESALRFGPDNAETLGYCAGALMLVGDHLDRAKEVVATALAILPDHQPTLLWGGWSDLLAGNPVRSIQRFERALQINPASGSQGPILCGQAFARMTVGDWNRARGDLHRAAALAPGFPLVAIGRGLVGKSDDLSSREPLPVDFVQQAVTRLPELLAAS